MPDGDALRRISLSKPVNPLPRPAHASDAKHLVRAKLTGEAISKRPDFACFIHHGAGTAAIDWEAAITALDAGMLPSSAGEKRMLRLAASLADQAHVSLGDAITGIDGHNVSLLIRSVRHAAGQRQF